MSNQNANVYPVSLRTRAHTLVRKQKITATQALLILQNEFPKYASRLDSARKVYSLIAVYEQRLKSMKKGKSTKTKAAPKNFVKGNSANPYSDDIRERAYTLCYHEDRTASQAVAILIQEFPQYAKRLTPTRLYAMNQQYRKKLSKEPLAAQAAVQPALQLAKKQKVQQKKQKYVKFTNNKQRDEIIKLARAYYKKGYTSTAICEILKEDYPEKNVPSPNGLHSMVRGRPEKGTSNPICTVTIKNPEKKSTITMELLLSEVEKLVKNQLM